MRFFTATAYVRRSARVLLPALLLLLLTLVAMLLGATQATPGYTLRAGDPGDRRFLVRFYDVEANAAGNYRWSQQLFGIYLFGFDGRPALVSLRATSPRPTGLPAPLLTSPTLGTELGSLPTGPVWVRYHMLVPTLPDGESVLAFQVAPFSSADDPRELGLVLTDVAVRPCVGQPRLPLPVRSTFLLSLPLLVWLLIVRLGRSPRLAWGLASGVALVMGWATAFPSASGYWLPTWGWPWWPLLPLLLLIFMPQLRLGLRWAWARLAARPYLGWLGLALALFSLVALRAGLAPLFGLSGLLVGVWMGWRCLPTSAEERPGSFPWWLLLIIVGLSLFLRLYNLDAQPAGLWRDESRHGLQALQIWYDPSYRPVYVAEGADLPALLFYLMAPVVGWFGPQVWSARLVAATLGGLMPLALFWAATPLLGRRPALIAAALLSWASWGLSMSRWAFPATLDHVLTLTAVGFAWRGLDTALVGRGRFLPALQLGLAGLTAGLATYAYHTGRVAPLALTLLVVVRLGRDLSAWRRAGPSLLVAITVGLITMAPLLNYIVHDYGNYNRRVGQVSILNSGDFDTHTPLGILLANSGRYLGMWHVRGEPNGRHHLPTVPLVDPVVGVLLLFGVVLALRSPRDPGRLAPLAIALVYLVPAIFSGDAPHAMRALGMLAPACMLAALAFSHLFLHPDSQTRRRIALALLLFSFGFNTWLYFGVMRVAPRVYGEFDLVETALGQAAQAPARSRDPELQAVRVYLPDKLRATDTLRFLSYAVPTYGYTGEALPSEGSILLLLPADASPAAQRAALAALGPTATALAHRPLLPGRHEPLLLAFGRGTAATRLAEELWP